jgi:hypothetical protein
MKEPLRALLGAIVDYAGLFPPAGLGMKAAVERFARYRVSSDSWMLGRFVVPFARLNELEEQLAELPAQLSWPLSLILSDEPQADLERLAELPQGGSGRFVIEALEIPPVPPRTIERMAGRVPDGVEAFFELPLESYEEPLRTAAREGVGAKLRTGGVTAEAFPEPAALVGFVLACARLGCAFKATAGLHHPLRASHRLTYEPDSPSGMMHGFLNVAVLAALARNGEPDEHVAEQVLEERSAASFRVDDVRLGWREHELGVGELLDARRRFFRSFGSCSFEEPVAELGGLF